MTNFVVFGASGDLAKNYLYPALDNLYQQGHKFNYFAFSRSEFEPVGFAKNFTRFTGNYDATGLTEIAQKLTPDSIFYFALPTNFQLISSLISGLNHHHLISKNTKLIIEKPFGSDSQSAHELMSFLDKEVGQDKIYLVDHYLTKELVKNFVSLRFANPLLANIWNQEHIAEIHITAVESKGIDQRGEYYDQIGAVRDMVQNHCLQLLTLATMSEPASFQSADFVDQKLQVLNHLTLSTSKKNLPKIGQYHGYTSEVGISPTSTTETFFQGVFNLDLPDWQSVPFTITTAKKLDQKLTEINIIFKNRKSPLWPNSEIVPNQLTINLYPDNDIYLSINTSFDPHKTLPQPQKLNLGSLSLPHTSSYQNVILDVVDGTKINTPSFSEILAQWYITEKILSTKGLRQSMFFY